MTNDTCPYLSLTPMIQLVHLLNTHSGGHSRAKMSSMSNALDSIASCSDGEDETSETSDKESGSSYYFDDDNTTRHKQGNNKVASTTTIARVWEYGEPHTNYPESEFRFDGTFHESIHGHETTSRGRGTFIA